MYHNKLSSHDTKILVRKEIIEDLNTLSKVHNRILTLPCLNFEVEIAALDLGFKVNTVERELSIFCQQFSLRDKLNVKNLKTKTGRYNLTLNNESAFDFLNRNKSKKFDLVYLDTCGALCQDSLFSLISLGVRKTPIVYVTFLFSRERNEYNHLVSKENRIADYERVFDFANYKIDKTYQYSNQGSSMCTFKLLLKNERESTRIITKEKSLRGKSFGSLSPFNLCIGNKLISAGFDADKRYNIVYDAEENCLLLDESILGRKFSKLTGGGYVTRCNMLYKRNNLTQKYYIHDVRNNDTGVWIFYLKEKYV